MNRTARLLLTLLAAVACAGPAAAAEFPDPFAVATPTEDWGSGTGVPAPWPDVQWRKNQVVEVEWEGSWYKASVLEVWRCQARIHYLGYGSEFDECVPFQRIREIGSTKPVGTALEVEWEGSWWPATELKVDGEFSYIHYDGWGDEWNEWVPKSRMRR